MSTNTNNTRTNNFIRIPLGILLSFAALNAFGGGYYALAGAEGVPLEYLKGSPFPNYFIPGLILFFIVGGSFFSASYAVFRKLPSARQISFISVLVVSIWLTVQISIIGYISWMQPVTAVAALIILILTFFLRINGPRRGS